MVFDAYEWSKKIIKEDLKLISTIRNDRQITSPGDIWSLKKFFITKYCIDDFVSIFKKFFKNYYYFDTHCGTGLIKFNEQLLKDTRFSRSCLISLTHPTKFTKYFLFDNNEEFIHTLSNRIEKLNNNILDVEFSIEKKEFSDSVNIIQNYNNANSGFLVIIDPVEFKEIHWNLMEKILHVKTTDIIFSFMTHAMARNRSISELNNNYGKLFTSFFGNEDWIDALTGEDLMILYVNKLKRYKKFVYRIPVYQTGKQINYHILIATNSNGANNVIKDAQKITQVNNKLLIDALKVVTGIQTEINDYFE